MHSLWACQTNRAHRPLPKHRWPGLLSWRVPPVDGCHSLYQVLVEQLALDDLGVGPGTGVAWCMAGSAIWGRFSTQARSVPPARALGRALGR